MNTIIKKLSQIEEKSVGIIANGTAEKKVLTEEYETRTRQFNEALNEKTERKLNTLRAGMEADIKARLKEQEAAADASILRLERHYERYHKAYVDRLFQSMTEV